jgi:hypothetical protein
MFFVPDGFNVGAFLIDPVSGKPFKQPAGVLFDQPNKKMRKFKQQSDRHQKNLRHRASQLRRIFFCESGHVS